VVQERLELDQMIRTLGLNHINLNVRDLQRSLEFYQTALGLKVRFWEGEKMVFVGAEGANDLITLHEVPADEPVAGGGVSHFGFRFDRTASMDEVVTQIERAGGKLRNRGHHGPKEPFAYFYDPDSYLIEIGN
jgi:catechol 2,3-dioxygenase-like lactoylglutathione lyase family enzyme